MRILVTGAGGFVGRALAAELRAAGHHVRGLGRSPAPEGATDWVQADLADASADLGAACAGMECVVHLAAHVHARPWQRLAAPGRFTAVNVSGTGRLAAAAQRHGVGRFVFLSSVGVYGPGAGYRYTESDPPQPRTAYGRSKLEAEHRLQAMCRGGAMECVIVRAPLVFGPGAPGNFGMLLHGLEAGWPIPMVPGAVRSMLYVDNLAVLLRLCAETAAPAPALYLASDHDFEISDLACRLASAIGTRARLVRLSPAAGSVLGGLPIIGGGLVGLTRSLLVDSSRARATLGWSPAIDAEAALARTVSAWRRARPL